MPQPILAEAATLPCVVSMSSRLAETNEAVMSWAHSEILGEPSNIVEVSAFARWRRGRDESRWGKVAYGCPYAITPRSHNNSGSNSGHGNATPDRVRSRRGRPQEVSEGFLERSQRTPLPGAGVLTGVGPLGEEGGIERATASSESAILGLVLR